MDFAYHLTPEDLYAHAEALGAFHAEFVRYFRTQTREVSVQALAYLRGQLLGSPRRNMNQMAIHVVQVNKQALSHFVSLSPWEEEPLIEALGGKAVSLLESPVEDPGALILDESGIPKQGTHSVGVARQYGGATGKVDNCQVGVFLAYAQAHQATLIDKRLYLPKAWIDDPTRCAEAGIPPPAQQEHTKAELGLEMILKAKQRGIPLGYVSMDAHYGQQPWLLSALEHEQIEVVADIPCDTRGYLEYPTVGLPPRKGHRGRKPTVPRVLHGDPVEVRHLLQNDTVHLKRIKVRDTKARSALDPLRCPPSIPNRR